MTDEKKDLPEGEDDKGNKKEAPDAHKEQPKDQPKGGEPDYEAQARKMGWKPEDEYYGDPDKWVPAKEFVERAPLYDDMRKLRRKTKDLEDTVGHLREHYQKVEENAYKRYLDKLKADKVKALEEGDAKKVVEIDAEIDDAKDAKRAADAKVQSKTTNRDFEEWVESNAWYERDDELKIYADAQGVHYKKQNPTASYQEILEHAAKATRKAFPDRFRNPAREKPSPVEGGNKGKGADNKPSWSSLPDHMKEIGDTFVKMGVMTRDQYMKDLIETGQWKP